AALAIKVLNQELANNPAVMERFSADAAKLRALRHPHLVLMKDLEVKAERVAIVMELTSGGTLADYLLLRGKVPTADALSITRQILMGLVAAHGAGLTHGRLTPQNVLLSSSAMGGPPTVKLSDYATLRLISGSEAATPYCLTRYMAPEIPSGEPASPASDLFSVGVILYEMLTGELPATAATAARKVPAEPLRRPAHITPPLWRVLTAWLSPRRVRRATNTWAALKSIENLRDAAAPSRPERQFTPAKQPGSTAPPLLVKTSTSAMTYAPTLTAPDVLEVVPDRLEVTSDLLVVASDLSLLTPPAASPVAPVPSDSRSGSEEVEYGSFESPTGERRPRRWPSRTRWPVAVAIIAALALVGGSIYGLSSFNARAKSYSYVFAVESSPQNDIQLHRTWTLTGGAHPVLHADLEFRETGSDAATVVEVLPSSLLAASTSVTFNPQPQRVDSDHVVRYSFGAGGSGDIYASYDVAVASKFVSEKTLQGWALEQQQETGALYRAGHQLASLSLAKSVTVTVGKSIVLKATAKQVDGTQAASVALGGARYKVDNTRIATVASDGRLTGKHEGKTTVHVTIGSLSVASTVIVKAAKASKTVIKPKLVPVVPSPTSSSSSRVGDAPDSNSDFRPGPDTNSTSPQTSTGTHTNAPPTTTHTTPATGGNKPPITPPTQPPTGNNGGGPTTGPTTAPTQPTSPPTTDAPSAGPSNQPSEVPPVVVTV
ncbi:MAG: serine/threonine protein kinase, partial [Mycobacterium sp.]|nr:serine/threonine protein kinase [Mycobacterium sp.]